MIDKLFIPVLEKATVWAHERMSLAAAQAARTAVVHAFASQLVRERAKIQGVFGAYACFTTRVINP